MNISEEKKCIPDFGESDANIVAMPTALKLIDIIRIEYPVRSIVDMSKSQVNSCKIMEGNDRHTASTRLDATKPSVCFPSVNVLKPSTKSLN